MKPTFTLVDAVNIAKEIAGPAEAYSFNGTLFVGCTPRQAAKIETALIDASGCGVIVSGVGEEFSFDFVG